MLLREIELLLWPVLVYVDAQEVASRPRVRALEFARACAIPPHNVELRSRGQLWLASALETLATDQVLC
ncbi:hypothetical protein C360_04076 [Cryptococcus neoformans Bt15]|nr:hypothetical protein C360_04076 [Cryptococcus neoformans var. grubii Bt15]